VERGEQFEDFSTGCFVELGGRFVVEQDIGPINQCVGDDRSASLGWVEFCGHVGLVAVQSHAFKGADGSSSPLPRSQSEDHRELDVAHEVGVWA